MNNVRTAVLIAAGMTGPFALAPAQEPPPAAIVTVTNPIDLARPAETVRLTAADLQPLPGVKDFRNLHVRDASGQDLLTQAIDDNDDGKFEELIFQTDLQPRESRRFGLAVGERQAPRREDYKAYGRFVRERRDDFAWENDRVAHRMYGAALETWAQDPLTSSAVDVWTKRVPRLIINDWYLLDDYHKDNGTGGDFYSAGKSRGCGGNGPWVGGKLFPSANFRNSRVLANGPIRVMFELSYEPWDAGGVTVSELKRITLDAGQNLSRFESVYTVRGGAGNSEFAHAAGIRKAPGSVSATNRDRGTLRSWEPMKGAPGFLGCAVIVDPSQLVGFAESDGNYLVVARTGASRTAVYHAGFAWDQAGQVATLAEWDVYLERFAQRLAAPLRVTVARSGS